MTEVAMQLRWVTGTVVRVLVGLGVVATGSACGKKETPAPVADVATPAPAEPAPAEPAPAEPAPTEPAPTEPAPTPDAPETAKPDAAAHWLAWRYDTDGELETALIHAKPAEGEAPALRKGDAVAAAGPRLYKLGTDTTTLPVKPCDEAADASFVALGLTGIEPVTPIKRIEIADAARRPQRDEARIHSERLVLLGQAGPLVWVHHEMSSDICPIPGTGAVYDAFRVVDVRDGRSVPFSDLYTADELAALTKDAFEAGWKDIREGNEGAPDDVKDVLKLGTIRCGWGDTGTLGCNADVYASHKFFADPDDEEGNPGVAAAIVPVPAPGRLTEYAAEAAPEAVVAFWKGGGDGGRGFSVVDDASIGGLRAWFAASAARDAATPTP